jgi:type I restriction enzyme S subunit
MTARFALLSQFAASVGSVDPRKYPTEVFDLYSIPAYESGVPETVPGSAIGSSKKEVQPGDVLLSRIVPHIRRAWVVGEQVGRRQLASGEWIVFRNAKIWPRYLKWIVVSDEFHAAFMRTVSGVGGSLLRARPSEVYKIEIPLPPLEEQKRIAAILDTADEMRAKRRQSIAELDKLLQSVFLDMFGDPVTNPKFPIKRLADFLSFITSGGRGWAKYYKSVGKRFIRSLDVGMNEIRNDEIVFVDPPNNAETERTRVDENDVLLTITGSRIGRVAKVPSTLKGSFVSQHVAILRVKKGLLPDFLSFYLSLEQGGQSQIRSKQYGQTKPGLNFEQIRSFEIPHPPLEAQMDFLDVFATVMHQKQLYQSQLAELDTLFASLQQRAFSGELSLNKELVPA